MKHTLQLGQKTFEFCFIFGLSGACLEKRIVIDSQLVDFLYNFISPFVVVFDLVIMVMGIFSIALFAEVGELLTIYFGTVIFALFLMRLAFLFNAPSQVLEFILGS